MMTPLQPTRFFQTFLLLMGGALVHSALADDSPPLPVSTMQLRHETHYTQYRDFTGRVEAGRTSHLGFELNGTLALLRFDEGETAKKGDLLAVLDTQKLRAGRKAASAEISRAKTALRLAQASLQRVSRIADKKLIDRQTLDEAQAVYDAAQAQLAQAEANRRLIDVDLEKSQLRAPYDGIVIKRSGDEGDLVTPGRTLFELQESGRYEARIGIANHMADRFKPGERVELEIAGKPLAAEIKAILPVRNPGVRTVDVILSLPAGGEHAPRPGDLVSWRLGSEVRTDGFWVPLSALTEGVRGLWNLYIVNAENTAELRMVDILHLTAESAYVRGLLSENERIIVGGTQRIVPNQLIQPLEAKL